MIFSFKTRFQGKLESKIPKITYRIISQFEAVDIRGKISKIFAILHRTRVCTSIQGFEEKRERGK